MAILQNKFIREDGSVIGSSMIISCKYTSEVNSQTNLTVGDTTAAEVDVEIRNLAKEITAGEKLTYYQIEDGAEHLIGVFYAEAPTIATKTSVRFKAYDGKAKLAVDFSEWLNNHQDDFPMSLRSLANTACEVAGVTLASDSFQFEDLSIPAFYADGVTSRQVVSWAAQIAGCFVGCKTNGEIFFDWYRSTSKTISKTQFAIDGLSKSSYTTDLIQRVQFKQSTDDVGAIYPADADGNVFSISQNGIAALLDSDTLRSIAQYLYNKLKTVTYTPLTVKLPKRTANIKAGDIISVTDGNGNTVTTYVMKVYLDAGGTTASSTGDQNYADKAAVSSEKYKNIPGKVLEIEKSVDGLRVKAAETDKKLTEIEVTTKGVDIASEDGNGKLVTFIGNADDGEGGTKGVWKAEYTQNGETSVSSGLYFDFSEDEFVFTGKIKGGSININDNFLVDPYGNVSLNGNITWGTSASPTQVVYASTALTKPSDGKKWSSFPVSGSGWHQSLLGTDYYASYTYDGGATWTDAVQVRGVNGSDGADGADGKDGDNGDPGSTVQIEYLYYRKVTSYAPSTPSYSGGTLPTGWTKEPSGVNLDYPYEFVSQCTVTDGKYGTWSTPVLWAKYGADGSDAEVTAINIFNAVTENGTKKGCFTYDGSDLYINADYIQAGMIAADRINTEDLHVKAANIDGTLTANQINATGLHIKAENVDDLQIGGRNYFTNAKRLKAEIYEPGTLELDDGECPHGFFVTGARPGNTTVRFSNVVTGNGEWTLSWEMRGSQSVAVGLSIDICDANSPGRFETSADNGWTSHSLTVNVANYSADIYNFVDFSEIDWAYIYVRNIKLEKGNKATDWTPAPEDVEVGRNLFLGTGDEISNNDYYVATYAPAGDGLTAGKTYTITACVTPGTGAERLALFLSGGYMENASLVFDGTSKQIVSKTFVASYYAGREPSVDASYAYANIYRLPNDGSVSSNTTIHWIKIEEGEQSTEWTPAPEDTNEIRKEMSALKVTSKGVDMVSENDDGKLVSFIGNGDDGGEWSATYYKAGSTTPSSGLFFDLKADEFVFTGKIKGGSININDRFKVDANGNVTLPDNASISWGQVSSKPSNLATTDYVTEQGYQTSSQVENAITGKGYQTATQVTQIARDTISTTNVIAENLRVKAANIDGALTFGDGSYYIDPSANDNYLNLPGLSITSSGAVFSGKITATAGEIGGFTLTEEGTLIGHGSENDYYIGIYPKGVYIVGVAYKCFIVIFDPNGKPVGGLNQNGWTTPSGTIV